MMRRTALLALAGALIGGLAWAQVPTNPLTSLPAPKVTLTTTMGVVEITLDPVGAPKTSAHMLRLFQLSHYVGAAVYRIEPGFLIQLGDLDAAWKHRWPPGGTVELETATTRHGRGTVSLARAEDPNSGHSTFYFDLGENASLNANPNAPPNTTGYATFGRVTAGMDVLDAIAAVPRAPTGGPFPGKAPAASITIVSIQTDPPAPPTPRATPSPMKSKTKAKAKKRRG
jgi:cyclophilin family peptidyl-prolyl cis-trans isomerase